MHTGSKICGNKTQHVRLTLQTGNRPKMGGKCTSQSNTCIEFRHGASLSVEGGVMVLNAPGL